MYYPPPAYQTASNVNAYYQNAAFMDQHIYANTASTSSSPSSSAKQTENHAPRKPRKDMAQFNCIERPLSNFFYTYGRWMAKWPWPFVAVPVLLTMALSLGMLHLNEVTDATYVFTPTDAISKYERQVIHEKWPLHATTLIPGRSVTQTREAQVIVRTRDNGNILQPPYAESVLNLNRYIVDHISVEHNGQVYRYGDLCLRWKEQACQPNVQINYITGLFGAGRNITFPMHRPDPNKDNYFERLIGAVYLGSSLGNVSLVQIGNTDPPIFHVQAASAWLMLFNMQFQPNKVSFVSGLWEQEFVKVLDAYLDPYIEVTYFHSQTLNEELKRNADTLVPKFAVAFAILVTFAMLSGMSMVRDSAYIDWVISKPMLGFYGCLNAGMGVCSSLGLLTFAGFEYNQIVLVMPFLVVAIGVDNMFLMTAAFRRTDRSMAVEDRVGLMLKDVAISITITALTDALSFGVGALTTIPAVQWFCVYTCIAIVITFIYQLTFFLAILVLYAKLESKCYHCLTLGATVNTAHMSQLPVATRMFKLGSRAQGHEHEFTMSHPTRVDDLAEDHTLMTRFFRDWYAPVLMEPVVRTLVLVWFAIYLAGGIWGCMNLKEGLEPINLLVSDSYAIPHYRRLEEYFWRYGSEVQVVVNNLPRPLSRLEERNKLDDIVHSFANTPRTIGDQGVQYWMHEMKLWLKETNRTLEQQVFNNLDETFYYHTRNFLSARDKWQNDVLWNEDETKMTSFRFICGMRNFETAIDQRATTELMRVTADKFPEYNITTFHPVWLFSDQYSLILPNTLQNIGIAMACMLVIALILIPHPMCALWVAVAIASIDVGVVGYMTWWGVNLDAISMITIIMSIGFSVDFSAHITYGYVMSDEHQPSERVRVALASLGWPILQGAISTIAGVSVLAGVNAYMIVTFFKTVFLVITLGCIHGLVFLPVLLSLFVRGNCGCTTRKVVIQGDKPKLTPDKPPMTPSGQQHTMPHLTPIPMMDSRQSNGGSMHSRGPPRRVLHVRLPDSSNEVWGKQF